MLPFFDGCEPFFRWKSKSDDNTFTLEEIESEAGELIEKTLKSRDDWVGILGFSQGGRMAAGLLVEQERREEETGEGEGEGEGSLQRARDIGMNQTVDLETLPRHARTQRRCNATGTVVGTVGRYGGEQNGASAACNVQRPGSQPRQN